MFLRKSRSKKAAFKSFVFELNSFCNHKCIYCYNFWNNTEYPLGVSDLDMWRCVIRKLKEETNIKLVSLSGGEPLLFPKIVDLVRLLVSEGVEVNIITNGSLLNEDLAKSLIKAGTSVFEISLPAHTAQLHLEMTGVKDFDKVLEGIVNVTSNGGKVVTVFVATKVNIEHIKNIVDLSLVLGAGALMFNRINLASLKHKEILPTVEQFNIALTYLNDFAREYEFPIICSVPIPPCLIDMSKFKFISHGYCPKEDTSMYPTIDYLGNVRHCNHTPEILGNILKDSLLNIMLSKERIAFKSALPQECRGCKRVSLCGGSCKASSLACYGNTEKLDPFVGFLCSACVDGRESESGGTISKTI